MKSRLNLYSFLFLLFFIILPLHSRNTEYYLEYKGDVGINKSNSFFVNMKEETRYVSGYNYYRKTSFGITAKVKSNLKLSVFYAFNQKKKINWNVYDEMLWLESFYTGHMLYRRFDFISKFERHIVNDEYRFRQKIDVYLLKLRKNIDFFIGDEARIFDVFDKFYFGKNEILSGFKVRFENLNFTVYYDLRYIKYHHDRYSNCFRFLIDLKI